MADKTTGGLTVVKEAAIGDLPSIADLYDDTLLPVEQQGAAGKMTGGQWKQYARAAVKPFSDGAAQSAQAAAESADRAAASAGKAQTAKSGAEAARDGARDARKAIEDMTVSAVTLPPGSAAAATKTAVGGSFNMLFGIPRGAQGATGAQGAQGIQGPPGRDGINGIAVPQAGQYAFHVNEAGHLILVYTGDTAPDFFIREDGHLCLNIA